MARLGHLTRRFFGSLRPGGPSRTEQAWAQSQLLPAEREIWCALSRPDRRHSAAVARRVEAALGSSTPRPVLAAALLHDSGKTVSELRTPGRVVATILAATTIRTGDDAMRWEGSSARWRRAMGAYRRHPEHGADMLAAIGSDPLTVAWTREHHLPPDRWTIDEVVATALHEADDD